MSFRGVRQLKELIVRYSDFDGSSRGIREWIRTDLIKIAKGNPQTQFRTELKRCCHPFLRGYYQNGNTKTICVKNLKPVEINSYFLFLRNQIGRRMNSTGYKKPIRSNNTSIQGEWNERMDLINYPLKITNF